MRSLKRPFILLRDSTLREGLDVPGVRFSDRQALGHRAHARRLRRWRSGNRGARARRRRTPVCQPPENGGHCASPGRSRVRTRPSRVRGNRHGGRGPRLHRSPDAAVGTARTGDPAREGWRRSCARSGTPRAPDAPSARDFRTPRRCLVVPVHDIAAAAAGAGASRIIVYDTNGSTDPFAARDLISSLASRGCRCPCSFMGTTTWAWPRRTPWPPSPAARAAST